MLAKQLLLGLTVLLLISVCVPAVAQSNLTGRVLDSLTREPLVYATVNLLTGTEATYTNEAGEFTLTTTVGVGDSLEIRYVGYRSARLPVAAYQTNDFAAVLMASSVELPTVEVRVPIDYVGNSSSILSPRISELQSIPALLGENDPLKGLAFLPGISSGLEGTSGVHIRGGNASQTDLLIDGVRVFNVNHIGGFISAIPAYGVKEVTVYKGGTPARFGGRLSGVVDIALRSGRRDKHTQEATIGTGLLRLGAEGPIGKKSSYIVHGRLGYPTLIYGLFSSGNYERGVSGYRQNFSLGDLYAKYTYEDRGWTIGTTAFLSADWGFDQNDFSSALYLDEFNWTNQLYALNARKRLGTKTTLLSTLSYLRYGYTYQSLEARGIEEVTNRQTGTIDFSTENLAADIRLTHTLNYKVELSGGAEGRIQRFESGFTTAVGTNDSIISSTRFDQGSDLLSVYGQVDASLLNNRVNLMAGLRYAYFASNVQEGRLQPRLRLSVQLLPVLFLNAGYDEHVQFDHQLSTDLSLFPNDLWLQSDTLLRPATSRQVYGGFGGRIGTASPIQWSVEVFHKTFSSLVEVQPGEENNIRLNQDLSAGQVATDGTGTAEGLEFFLRRTTGDFQFWLAYTLSRSERRYPTINEGNAFPFTFDRRHDLSLRVSQILTRGWSVNGSFVFQSGIAFTAPIATSASFDIYTDFNNARYPPFHVLNVGASKAWTGKRHPSRRHELTFSVYNLYNRPNAYSIEIQPFRTEVVNPDTGAIETEVRKQVFTRSLLPIVPGVSYRATFE